MRLVRLMRLSASAFSKVCNSYQIKHITLVYTISLFLTLLISFFLTQNWTIPALNVTDVAPGASIIFMQNNVTDPNHYQLKP